MSESKADKFKRLSATRINKIISACDGLAKLSSVNYEYTDEQVKQIEQVTSDALSDCMTQFEEQKNKGVGFSW